MGKGKRRNQRNYEEEIEDTMFRMRNTGFEHDDRKEHESIRRVSFKNQNGHDMRKQRTRQRNWDAIKIKNYILQDNDIEMSGERSRPDRFVRTVDYTPETNNEHVHNRRSKYTWKVSRKNYTPSGKPHHKGNRGQPRAPYRMKLPETPNNWYKICIMFGNRYDKEYLLKLLSNYIKPTPLLPFSYRVGREESTFIVDNRATAEDLLNSNKRITLNDGCKLIIKIRLYSPIQEVDAKMSELMKKAMATRYNSFVKALDISKFHTDPIFLMENILCPLSRSNVMINAIDIISDFIPDLVALNLSENHIHHIDVLKALLNKLPDLKSLSLARNKLRDIKQLDALKGLKLEELNLDGNPLCAKFQNQDDYIRAVRTRFPKVVKLDELTLPPPILFDEEEAKLPTSKPSFMCDPGDGMNISKMFLERYYQIYDSDDRTMLLEAYHDEAQFSFDCCSTLGDQNDQQLWSTYLQSSRNLFKVHADKRLRLLKKGKGVIIDHLKLMPKTQHDPSSFLVDLVLFSPELIQLNVCGLFKESDKPNATIKYFSRVFIIIPVGTGFCIVNEQLSIIPASAEQLRKIAKVKEAPIPQPIPSVSSPVIVPPIPGQIDIATKQEMVIRLSSQTGMNIIWSEKCLNETDWNYDQAIYSFSELQKTNSVPPEAFVK